MTGSNSENLNMDVPSRISRCNLTSDVSYMIHLDKKVYYGGDQISGFVKMTAPRATSINILNVAIVCRLRWKSTSGRSSGHTLYSASKIIGRGYHVKEGLTRLSFTFGLPDHLVVTHNHTFCSVQWDARLVEADWKPMAYCRFTMSALYYAQMNMGPRVQREVFVENKNPALRAEISLSQDVYQEGEPIDIRLAMHKNGAVVRSVAAHVTQHVLFDCGIKSTRKKLSQTMVDHTKLRNLTKKNHWTKIGTAQGSTCVRKFNCVPSVPKKYDDRTAVQLLRDCDGKRIMLAPSNRVECSDTMQSVAVSYTVDVTIHTRGCKDLTFSVPFILQGNPPKQSDNSNSAYQVQSCFTFPRSIEQPPDYIDYKCASVKSFTSLRPEIESLDSVFFKPDSCTTAPVKNIGCGTFKSPTSLQPISENFQSEEQFVGRSDSIAGIGFKKKLQSLSASNYISYPSKKRVTLAHLSAIGNPAPCISF